MGATVRLPRKLKKDIKAWFQDGVVPSARLRRWARRESDDLNQQEAEMWQLVAKQVINTIQCSEYRPDHNGECLNCDEPYDAHQLVRTT